MAERFFVSPERDTPSCFASAKYCCRVDRCKAVECGFLVNAADVGISQSLFAQYISGIKTPSAHRLEQIYSTLRSIGKELMEDAVIALGNKN